MNFLDLTNFFFKAFDLPDLPISPSAPLLVISSLLAPEVDITDDPVFHIVVSGTAILLLPILPSTPPPTASLPSVPKADVTNDPAFFNIAISVADILLLPRPLSAPQPPTNSLPSALM